MFEAYPFVFTNPHHLSAGLSGLTFLPVAVGGTIAVILVSPLFLGMSGLLMFCLFSMLRFSIPGTKGRRRDVLHTQSPRSFV